MLIAILAYSITQQQFYNYRKQSAETTEAYRALQLLRNDSFKNELNTDKHKQLIFSNYQDSVTYQFETDELYRFQAALGDTLFNTKVDWDIPNDLFIVFYAKDTIEIKIPGHAN